MLERGACSGGTRATGQRAGKETVKMKPWAILLLIISGLLILSALILTSQPATARAGQAPCAAPAADVAPDVQP
jgi:hypothetical protein